MVRFSVYVQSDSLKKVLVEQFASWHISSDMPGILQEELEHTRLANR